LVGTGFSGIWCIAAYGFLVSPGLIKAVTLDDKTGTTTGWVVAAPWRLGKALAMRINLVSPARG
jgi:hypothetical protein